MDFRDYMLEAFVDVMVVGYFILFLIVLCIWVYNSTRIYDNEKFEIPSEVVSSSFVFPIVLLVALFKMAGW